MIKPSIMGREEFDTHFSQTDDLMYSVYRFGFLDCSVKFNEVRITEREKEIHDKNDKSNRLSESRKRHNDGLEP